MTTGCRDIQRNINDSEFNIFVTAPLAVSLNISASSGRRRMRLPPFDAARRGDSNELCCILPWPLDAEIFDETVNGNVKFRIVDVSLNISASSGRRRMKPQPFDAVQRGGSNELCYILLRPLDAEIINETQFFDFLILTCWNYFSISTRQVPLFI